MKKVEKDMGTYGDKPLPLDKMIKYLDDMKLNAQKFKGIIPELEAMKDQVSGVLLQLLRIDTH